MDNTHLKEALYLFDEKGSSCSQSVLAVFDKELGFSRDTLLKLASPHGGGVGRMGGMCGALAAAVMAYGIIKGSPFWKDKDEKEYYYKDIRAFVKDFEDTCGAVNCPELLALAEEKEYLNRFDGADYTATRPCSHFVAKAVKMIEDIL